MTTSTNPQIGARILTHKGNSGIIEQLENERVVIRVPDGSLKSIPLTAITRSIPGSLKPAQHGAVWDETENRWLEPEYLGLLSMADLTGIPNVKQCRQGFGRYVSLSADGSFNRCTQKDPSDQKFISRLVPFDQVPALPTTPVSGQQVKLKGTSQTYTLLETYRAYCGRGSDDQPFYEEWARLQTADHKPATWKLNQLEAIA